MKANQVNAKTFWLSAKFYKFFKHNLPVFLHVDSQVAFILSLLSGTALSWVGPLIRSKSTIISTTESLMNELISVFDHNITAHDAATRLMQLKQGKKSVADFSIIFCSLASETGWAEGALMTIFVHALSEPVRDALATLEPLSSLDALARTAIRIDNRVREREREKLIAQSNSNKGFVSYPKSFAAPVHSQEVSNLIEPMQVDGSFIPPVKEPQKRPIICFNCYKPGHIRPRFPDLLGDGKSP